MIIYEFRIPLHMTVNEFHIAQLYMVAKSSEEETKDGEGVEIIKNEPFDNTDGHMGKSQITDWKIPFTKGQYTLKHYYIQSKFPTYLQSICPADSMVLIEESWNAYPHCVTVIVNGYLSKSRFYINIESIHLPDNGSTENALQLKPDELLQRKYGIIDITQNMEDTDYHEHLDPTLYKSIKTGRGPLSPGWHVESITKPIMTCYKLIRANFEYWGFQGQVESLILQKQKALFHLTLRKAQCLTDEWHGLDIEAVRKLEEETQKKLIIKRHQNSNNSTNHLSDKKVMISSKS